MYLGFSFFVWKDPPRHVLLIVQISEINKFEDLTQFFPVKQSVIILRYSCVAPPL